MPETYKLYDVLYKRQFQSQQPKVMFGGNKCLGYQADLNGFAPYAADDGSLANTGNVILVSEELFSGSWNNAIQSQIFFNDVYTQWRRMPDGYDLRLAIPVSLPGQRYASFPGQRYMFVLDQSEIMEHVRHSGYWLTDGVPHELTRSYGRVYGEGYTYSEYALGISASGQTVLLNPASVYQLRPSFLVPGDAKCFYDSNAGAYRLASTMMDVYLGTGSHGTKRAHELYLGTPQHGIKRATEGYTQTGSGLVRLF